MRRGAVARLAPDRQRKHVAGGHALAVGDVYLAGVDQPPDMSAVDSVNALHQPALDRAFGAQRELFGGLEEELDRAAEFAAHLRKDLRRAELHRDMRVVPAGVHPALVPRGEGKAGRLFYGQGVDVGAQQHRFSGRSAFQRRDAAVHSLEAFDGKPHRLEVLNDGLRRLRLVFRQFGTGVVISAPLHDIVVVFRGQRFDVSHYFAALSSVKSFANCA